MDAFAASARTVALIVGVAAAACAVLGAVLGLAQGESVLRWIAYGLYIAGAGIIAYAFLAGAPTSGSKAARRRLMGKELEPREKPLRWELPLLVAGGLALVGVGTLLETL